MTHVTSIRNSKQKRHELRDVTALIIMPVAIQRDLADASAAVAQATSGSFSFSAAAACPSKTVKKGLKFLTANH